MIARLFNLTSKRDCFTFILVLSLQFPFMENVGYLDFFFCLYVNCINGPICNLVLLGGWAHFITIRLFLTKQTRLVLIRFVVSELVVGSSEQDCSRCLCQQRKFSVGMSWIWSSNLTMLENDPGRRPRWRMRPRQ